MRKGFNEEGDLTKLREFNLERIFLIKAGELMWKANEIKKGAELKRELHCYFVAEFKACIEKQAQLRPRSLMKNGN